MIYPSEILFKSSCETNETKMLPFLVDLGEQNEVMRLAKPSKRGTSLAATVAPVRVHNCSVGFVAGLY